MKANFVRTGVAALALAMAGSLAAWAAPADEVYGVWKRPSKGWLIEFKACESDANKLCGEVIAGEGKDKGTGGPVVGVQMLYDLERASDTKWKGKMYNPGDGNVYAGSVTMLKDGRIKMAGCMAGILCRSEKWPRAAGTDDTSVEPGVEDSGD